MKLSAVVLARVVFFVESVELNPRGAAYYPDIIKALAERYQFKSFPEKFEDFDEVKGVVLTAGKQGGRTIEKVTINNWGLTLDTTSSTRDSEELLVEALTWASENLRLHYSPEMVKRKTFVSQVLFYSDAPLLFLNPILDSIGERISKEVAENLKLPYEFKPNRIGLGVDPEEIRIAIAPFAIERRDGVAYSEGKYFSSAPVSTETHLSLLEAFEQAAEARNA